MKNEEDSPEAKEEFSIHLVVTPDGSHQKEIHIFEEATQEHKVIVVES